MPEITVTNKRDQPSDASAIVYIGRPSPLGNPYVIGPHGSREQVVAKYARWLGTTDAALAELRRIKRLLDDGESVALECWCAPLPCHGDVIKQTLLEWVSTGQTPRSGVSASPEAQQAQNRLEKPGNAGGADG